MGNHLLLGLTSLLCTVSLAEAAAPTLESLWKDSTEESRREIALTRYDSRGHANPLPIRKRTPEEKQLQEKRLEWFYKAKYGIMVHFIPGISLAPWSPEEWDKWVEEADVEAFAKQCAEIGAGYVLLTVGQWRNYYCTPRNPVYEDLWGFEPGRYSSRRDLPMDLYRALKRYNIRLMLYVTSHPFTSDGEAVQKSAKLGWDKESSKRGKVPIASSEKWCKALEWWSRHYGKACSGWWIDGHRNYAKGHALRVDQALRSGNPDALIGSSFNIFSDYGHGHAIENWSRMMNFVPPQGPAARDGWNVYTLEELAQPIDPEKGRWIPIWDIQWHALLYLGSDWANSDTPKKTGDLVTYADRVISRGGVITFEIGARRKNFNDRDRRRGPYLRIPEAQMEQLRAIQRAVKPIKR